MAGGDSGLGKAAYDGVPGLLRKRADSDGSKTAYVFLGDGSNESGRLSYGELHERAQIIAFHLLERAEPGDRALLLYPQGLRFIEALFGCLYAGVLAIPGFPPRPNRSGRRIHSIACDAQPSVALTTADLLPSMRAQFTGEDRFPVPHWLATDELGDEHQSFAPPRLSPHQVAFLQYTSGSTSSPKGVMVTHDNVLSNLREIDDALRHSSDSVLVTWLPTFHDMGLIYGVLMPLYRRFPCYLMPPIAFLQKPLRWLQAMSDLGATHSAAPNFAYDLCVRKTKAPERALLDLRSWQVAVNGAEIVRSETIDRFSEIFAPAGFQKCAFCAAYGLAEATLKVTSTRFDDLPVSLCIDIAALEQYRLRVVDASATGSKQVVSCGAAEGGTRVAIVNPETRTRCKPGEVGEIWISGPGVASGYWNRPADNIEVFAGRLADDDTEVALRSGDLGFLFEGNLYVAGRLKDMIIIRGQNYYPQDIEWTVEQSHPMLHGAWGAAFSVQVDGEERLVVVHELSGFPDADVDAEELIESIRESVAEAHELQVYAAVLVRGGQIPKTSSGKVQRAECRRAYLSGSLKIWDARGTRSAPAV